MGILLLIILGILFICGWNGRQIFYGAMFGFLDGIAYYYFVDEIPERVQNPVLSTTIVIIVSVLIMFMDTPWFLKMFCRKQTMADISVITESWRDPETVREVTAERFRYSYVGNGIEFSNRKYRYDANQPRRAHVDHNDDSEERIRTVSIHYCSFYPEIFVVDGKQTHTYKVILFFKFFIYVAILWMLYYVMK